ncbi:arginine deiminase-related protein [Luteimonas kalidii]|uniref:Arginine deiminase-related protein n=1 Tax=Luteimonas kalidii TaxID=3042025 RepID=A0ABT6JXQ7_9GAMM|nr:arginine deiminase-related protein [Luteimonas kalidii]MDH5835367.1 arginine deiminase-related protein [Luteimonas kalidii]
MITRDVAAFLAAARDCMPDFGPATARAAFLVAPDGFARADESAGDNRYMAAADGFDAALALRQHRALHMALSRLLPTACFAGAADTPDALFPNNVFATARADACRPEAFAPRLVVGRMRHAVRWREAAREDIRAWFRDVMGYEELDLSAQPHPCELTGALVIDRARGLGYCGLSERCDAQGAALLHAAFGLRATLAFELAPGEYHANVVLAVLAGRAMLVSPDGFADPGVASAIAGLYPHAARLEAHERQAFAGNAISLTSTRVSMSATAHRALSFATQDMLASAGFSVESVELSAIEAAGGSLRCCVAEVF